MSLVTSKSSLTENAVDKLKKSDAEKYAKLPAEGVGPCEIQYEIPDTLVEIGKVFTDKVAFNLFVGHVKFSIEGRVRKLLAEEIASGKSLAQAQREIQNKFYNLETKEYVWKPSDSPQRMSAAEKEAKRISKLPKEKQADEIAALKAQLAKLEGK